MAAAANNWSGLVNLYLDQERDKQKAVCSNQNDNLPTKTSGFCITQLKNTLCYMPTYRLSPKYPLNKEKCEIVVHEIMSKTFEDYDYHPNRALKVTKKVGEEIKTRIKALGFDRYRYIVIVTIGEVLYQGYCSLVNFLWDAEKDGYMKYTIETPKYFVVATLYYIYYD